MNTNDAKAMAEEMIKKHGLDHWKFRYLMDEKNLGLCTYRGKIITLSLQWTKNGEQEVVKDTVLHEVSHALNWERNRKTGHGLEWKRICIEVGAKPQEFYTGPKMPPKYEIYHKDTNKVIKSLREYPSWASDLLKPGVTLKGLCPSTRGKLRIRRVETTVI